MVQTDEKKVLQIEAGDREYSMPQPITLKPEEGRRLVFDLPNGALRCENGIMRLVLEPDASLTIWQRTAP